MRRAAPLAAALLAACALSRETRPPSAGSPSSRACDALLDAARRLDARALESLVSGSFSDESGRNRAVLLDAVRADAASLAGAEIETLERVERPADGGTFVAFAFTARLRARGGGERLVKGRAEWLLRAEGGLLLLASARGDPLLGFPPP